MARIEIDILDYIDEINSSDLIDELEKRGYFETPDRKLKVIRMILNLRFCAEKHEIIEEINSL